MATAVLSADPAMNSHPLMKRFHRPEDEKRMVVILDPEDYGNWLTCGVQDAPAYFRQWNRPLVAQASPLPPRAPKAGSVRTLRPPKPPETGSLF